MSKYVEYDSNNSGGGWWLGDEDWKALEAAGWEVDWYKLIKRPFGREYPEGRFLGALASRATRRGVSLEVAIFEWEQITGQRASALGCSCCGTPHSFDEYDEDGRMVESYSPDYPEFGDDY